MSVQVCFEVGHPAKIGGRRQGSLALLQRKTAQGFIGAYQTGIEPKPNDALPVLLEELPVDEPNVFLQTGFEQRTVVGLLFVGV